MKCGCKTQGPFTQQNISGWGVGPVFTLCILFYNYVPVLNYCNVFMFYNS